MADSILKFEHITKRFSGVTALDDVSFSVEKGKVHVLAGENGAGKSTILKRSCSGESPCALPVPRTRKRPA